MSRNQRFLDPAYVLHSLQIKAKAHYFAMAKGVTPYEFFHRKVSKVDTPKYSSHFHDIYHALTYFEGELAAKFHAPPRSVTQNLILGLTYYNDHVRGHCDYQNEILQLADSLTERAEKQQDSMIFYFTESYQRFHLHGRYASAIVQGKAASFYLRCYRLTHEKHYLALAKKCLNAGMISIESGGVLRKLSSEFCWAEEYPSPSPSMVLNGFLFYIIGLLEFLSFEVDATLQAHLDQCMISVLSWLPHYRVESHLLYSMYRWSFCNVHYTGIMKYQFEHIYQLAGIETFKSFALFTDEITNWRTFRSLLH